MIARTARHVALAVQFYTRLPVRGRLAAWVGYRPELLRGATAHLPLVGWLVGGAAAAAAVAVGQWWPPAVVAVACTAVTVAVTGAFHEDGLADTADALGGHVDRDRALQIMTDSRLGTYGVLALVLAVAAKLAALSSLAAAGGVVVALLVAHVLSRTCPLLVMRALPYVGAAAGKAKPMADRTTTGALATALAQAAPALALLAVAAGPVRAAVVVAALAAVAALAVVRLRRRLGGFTGDTLGATQQVAELAVYLVLVA